MITGPVLDEPTTAPTRTEAPLTNSNVFERLFTKARTIRRFDTTPVAADTISRIEELTFLGPTAMNSQPLRIAWLRSSAARARLLNHLDQANQAKAASATLNAVLSFDVDWHHKFELFAPHITQGRSTYDADKPRREVIGNDNAHIEAGYFILAVRAVGLAAGPMSGIDPSGIAAEFSLPPNWRPFLVVNIGHPDNSPIHPRLPRLTGPDCKLEF